MNRIATCAAVAALGLTVGTGCSNAAKAPATAGTGMKSPAQADYFEMRQDGQTYILGSNASREAFMNGKMPPMTPTYFENGKKVLIEDRGAGDYARLCSEYKKSKGL